MSKIITDLDRIDEQEKKLAIERTLTLEKAFRSSDIDAIYKAQGMYNQFMSRYQQQNASNNGMKSMTLDPFEISSSMGYYGKNAIVGFETLRAVRYAPIIAAIINTRKNQVVEFCKPQPDKYSKGFKFVKLGTDEDDLTDGDKRIIDKLTQFILNCGDNDKEWENDDFDNFVKKLVDDSLTLDAAACEVIPSRGFEPRFFAAVDSATIRFADTHGNTSKEGALKVNGSLPSHVQVWQNQVIAEFYPWEMMYGIRNPSSAIRSNGYGKSELEYLISTVTAMLNGDSYNANFFKQGSAPKGMMMLKKGNLNKDRLQEFKRDWSAMLGGVSNSHKTAFLDAESFEWVDLHKNNRDMEFSKYQEYLIKLACAVYKISPEEIGFTLEGSKGGGIGNGDSGKAEKEYSVNKGLKPILTELQQWINKWIIYPKTNKRFEFQFAGLEAESAKEEEEKIQKAVTLYLTVDEVRKAKGMKPLPDGMGKLPLNPIFSQMKMQGQQMGYDQQQEQDTQDDQKRGNDNPFLDSEEDQNPMQKSFDVWFEKEMIVA